MLVLLVTELGNGLGGMVREGMVREGRRNGIWSREGCRSNDATKVPVW